MTCSSLPKILCRRCGHAESHARQGAAAIVASIGKIASPVQGVAYYERDGYYSKDDPWQMFGESAMATINVRHLDNDVVRRLKRRVADNDRSLEGEVRHILAGAVEDETSAKRASFRVLAARLRRETESRAQTLSEVLIREDRESGLRVV